LAGDWTAIVATYFFAWIAFAVIVGVAASWRGRVGYGWFLLTLVISPLITGPLVLVLPRQHAEAQIITGTATGGARAAGSTSTPLFAIAKWFGITILFVILAAVFFGGLAIVLIALHGG
jgi:hypothetical protein